MVLLELQVVLENLMKFRAFLVDILFLLKRMKFLPLRHVDHARHCKGWLDIYRLILRFQLSLLIHTDRCRVSIRIHWCRVSLDTSLGCISTMREHHRCQLLEILRHQGASTTFGFWDVWEAMLRVK